MAFFRVCIDVPKTCYVVLSAHAGAHVQTLMPCSASTPKAVATVTILCNVHTLQAHATVRHQQIAVIHIIVMRITGRYTTNAYSKILLQQVDPQRWARTFVLTAMRG